MGAWGAACREAEDVHLYAGRWCCCGVCGCLGAPLIVRLLLRGNRPLLLR